MIIVDKELRSKYWIDEENFGTVRMGDTVGISAFVALMRFQLNNPAFTLYIPKGYHLAEGILPFLDAYFMLKYDHSIMSKLPYSGNIWGWYEYAYKYYDINPIIKYPFIMLYEKPKQICINPIFDAPYSKDRNWKPELLQKAVEWVGQAFPDYKIVVTASPSITLPPLPSTTQIVQSTVAASIREILSSEIYIGGETGLTHFSFNTWGNPLYAICLIGERIEEYTTSLTKKDVPKLFKYLTVPKEQEYAFEVCTLPRPMKEKRTLTVKLSEGDYGDFGEWEKFLLEAMQNPPLALYENLPEEDKGVVVELGYGRTLELAHRGKETGEKVISVSAEYSKKVRKLEELSRENLYTQNVQVICEDEEWFKKNWVETGRKWTELIES